jgi:hypothetical protein
MFAAKEGCAVMGGIFINYRAVDNPLGAAAIHDALARRFGADRVFRDSVSLAAGVRYPTAIRDALVNADLVVSVIGPRWLQLLDDRTGMRLIDREYDWVRRELAWAFELRIAVLPVLLKDTPEQAVLPRPSELPPDIEQLALIQAFPVSQQRFGEDLDRLTTVLLRLVPTLGAPPETTVPRNPIGNAPRTTPENIFFELVEALEMAPCMHTASSRALVVSQLPFNIAASIREHPQRRMHIAHIVQTCLNYDAVGELLALVSRLEKGSRHLVRLAAVAERLGDAQAAT